jgi:hypothetical protein
VPFTDTGRKAQELQDSVATQNSYDHNLEIINVGKGFDIDLVLYQIRMNRSILICHFGGHSPPKWQINIELFTRIWYHSAMP